MMAKTRKNPQKSEQNSKLVASLSVDQMRYVAARLSNPKMSKKDIAELIEVSVDTVYKWSDADAFVESALLDIISAAQSTLEKMLMEAVMVKMAGLDSDDESIRQKTASEIMDRVMGKALQKSETDLTTNGKDLQIILKTGMSTDDL